MTLSGHSGETKESSRSGRLGERNGWRGAQSRALPDDDDDDAATKGKVTSGTSQSSRLLYHHADGTLQICTSPQQLSTGMRERMQARKRKKRILEAVVPYCTVGCPDPG